MRNLYLAFVAAFVVLSIGFWSSTFGATQPLGLLRIVHGALATLWMVMLIVQAWLAGRWKIRQHRVTGWTSVAIVPALVVSAILVVADMIRHSTYFPRDLRLSLAWADLTSITLFSLLWGLAIHHRKSWPMHARYIGCTLFAVFPPALGRFFQLIPDMGGLDAVLHATYLSVEIAVALLIVRDLVKKGRPAPYVLTLIATVGIEYSMRAAPHWGWFVALAEAIGPIG